MPQEQQAHKRELDFFNVVLKACDNIKAQKLAEMVEDPQIQCHCCPLDVLLLLVSVELLLLLLPSSGSPKSRSGRLRSSISRDKLSASSSRRLLMLNESAGDAGGDYGGGVDG